MKTSTLEQLTAQTEFAGFSNDRRFNLLIERNKQLLLVAKKPPHIQEMSFTDKKEMYGMFNVARRIKAHPGHGPQSLFSEEELLMVLYLLFINTDKSRYDIDAREEAQYFFFFHDKIAQRFRVACIHKTYGDELSSRVIDPGMDKPSFKDGDILIHKKE